jgi:hypothetical protein
MPWYWSWTLVLGVIVSLGGVLASRLSPGSAGVPPASSGTTPGSASAPPALPIILGALLAVIVCFVCLLALFPFSAGQQLAYGILIGLGAALLSLVLFLLSRPSDSYASEACALAAAAGPAVIAIAAIEIAYHGDPTSALFGCLVGGLLTLLPLLWMSPETSEPFWFFSLALLLLGLGSLLAIERFNTPDTRPYWALTSIGLAAGLLGAVVGALLLGRTRLARLGVAAFVVILGLAAWWGSGFLLQRSNQLTAPIELPYLLGLGWIAFALIAAFSIRPDDSLFSAAALPMTGLAALIIGFNIFGGSGVALSLAAGLPLSLAFSRGDKSARQAVAARQAVSASSGLWLAALGVLFLAYRLFLARYAGEVRGDIHLEFGRHYVLLGLAAALIWTSAAAKARPDFVSAFLQLLALGIVAPVLFFVFGYEALLGLVLGMWLWQLLLPNLSPARWAPANLPASYLPLVTIWALIIPNWAHFIVGQARWVRGLAAAGAVVLALLLLALVNHRKPAVIEPIAEKS